MDRQKAELQNQVSEDEIKALWVFGYGSLCWKPGFQFNKAVTGYVKGFLRRFWQGNTTHRGTVQQPGRVATLVEGQGIVHGIAFSITGEAAIPYLAQRECKLGGYETHIVTFHPTYGEPFKVLVYIATPTSELWMGYADETVIANEIITSRGPSGYNAEYIFRLANFVREHFSDECDAHLFKLEAELLALVASNKLCLKTLMGNGEECIAFVKCDRSRVILSDETLEIRDTFQYTLQVQETKSVA